MAHKIELILEGTEVQARDLYHRLVEDPELQRLAIAAGRTGAGLSIDKGMALGSAHTPATSASEK